MIGSSWFIVLLCICLRQGVISGVQVKFPAGEPQTCNKYVPSFICDIQEYQIEYWLHGKDGLGIDLSYITILAYPGRSNLISSAWNWPRPLQLRTQQHIASPSSKYTWRRVSRTHLLEPHTANPSPANHRLNITTTPQRKW